MRRNERVCFHHESARAELAVAERLRAEVGQAEAVEWVTRGAGRTAQEIPGHTHMWNTRFDDEGTVSPSNAGGVKYSQDPMGNQHGSARHL